jgi:thioredoxin-like negative regulator of GroEL
MRTIFLLAACCTLATPALAVESAFPLSGPPVAAYPFPSAIQPYGGLMRDYSVKVAKAQKLVAAGRYGEAEPVVDELLRKVGTPDIQFLKGITLLGQGQPHAARGYFQAVVLRYNTRHAGAMSGLALADIRLGDADAARSILDTLRAQQAKCDNGCSRAPSLNQAVMVVEKALG